MRRHRHTKRRYSKLLAAIVMLAVGYTYLADAPPRPAIGPSRTTLLPDGEVIEYMDSGDGPTIIMLASLGRSVSDFNELIPHLNATGYRTLAVQSRGIGRSGGGNPFVARTLFDYADDIISVLADAGIGADEQVQILGHAFGNRVARAFAARYPQKIDRVILLAAGGKTPIRAKVKQALFGSFLEFLPRQYHDQFLRTALFAPASPIPDYWRRGWGFVAALAQLRAIQGDDYEAWWGAGGRPILLLQGDADAIAPAADTAQPMKREFGDRVHVITIAGAGHAMLPEQPQAVAETLLDNL